MSSLNKIKEFKPEKEVNGVLIENARYKVLARKCQLRSSEGDCPCDIICSVSFCQIFRILENKEGQAFGDSRYMTPW